MSKKTSNILEEVPRKIKIFVFLLMFIMGIGILGFKFLEKVTIQQAFIRTAESFAFIFNAEAGLSKSLEIFLALFGVFLLWWIFWGFFDIVSEGALSEYLKTSRFFSKLGKMKDHYIIAGGGRVGEEMAQSFSKSKKPFIMIEKDEEKVAKLKKKGFAVLHGDVEEPDEEVLKQANVKDAKAIILAMPETEKNLLVTLMAKEINPNIDVYARADNAAFVSKLKKAGAKTVIVPEVAAAEKLLKEIT
jgi:voltage-gated potassium channel